MVVSVNHIFVSMILHETARLRKNISNQPVIVVRNTGNNQRIFAIKIKIGNSPELFDKSKAVPIYCRTGGRSVLAA